MFLSKRVMISFAVIAVLAFGFAASATYAAEERAPVPQMGGPGTAPGSSEAAPVAMPGGPGTAPGSVETDPPPPHETIPGTSHVIGSPPSGPPPNPCVPINTSPRVCGKLFPFDGDLPFLPNPD